MIQHKLHTDLAADGQGIFIQEKIVVVGQSHAALGGVAGTQAD